MKKKLPKQIKNQKTESKLDAVLEAASRKSKFDGNGSYTGKPIGGKYPAQDADDL
jgi:hypothetical protein